MRRIIWTQIEANKKWLRGTVNYMDITVWSRDHRNVEARDIKPILDWIAETNFPAEYMGLGMFAFPSEAHISLFLLKWTQHGT
jgi:hypothetical protein